MASDAPTDVAAAVNGLTGGWDAAMGVRYLEATRDRVVAEYTVGPQHLQPYGIAHGGVHCGVVEGTCSMGAGLDAMARGLSVVGIENHTSFIRAVRTGTTVRVTATPITRGRRSQVWEAVAKDPDDRIVATGRVRLLCLEAGSELAGETVGARSPGTRG